MNLPTNHRFERVISEIDRRNAADPRRNANGEPEELGHAKRLTAWVKKLRPNADDVLLIAARGQHLERWKIPRDRYPEGRGGYLRWREDMKKYHSDAVGEIMETAGYPADQIERTKSLMRKKNMATDAAAQALEDGLCLVFLETQWSDFRRKVDAEKGANIVIKTWRKMSAAGRALALTIPYSLEDRAALREILDGAERGGGTT